MKFSKFIAFTAIAIASTSCSSSSNENAHSEETHDVATCTEHNHDHHSKGHHHEMVVVGVALEGDYTSGKIAILSLGSNDTTEFDYSTSNQDKIAAWQTGDTVSIFIEHHHHGDVAHDSITAIKLGAVACAEPAHKHEHHKQHHHAH